MSHQSLPLYRASVGNRLLQRPRGQIFISGVSSTRLSHGPSVEGWKAVTRGKQFASWAAALGLDRQQGNSLANMDNTLFAAAVIVVRSSSQARIA